MRARDATDPVLLKSDVGGAALPIGTWDSRMMHGAFGHIVRVGPIELNAEGERNDFDVSVVVGSR